MDMNRIEDNKKNVKEEPVGKLIEPGGTVVSGHFVKRVGRFQKYVGKVPTDKKKNDH
jgi:hypothetical protein